MVLQFSVWSERLVERLFDLCGGPLRLYGHHTLEWHRDARRVQLRQAYVCDGRRTFLW